MNATFTTAEITAATEAISSSYPNLGRRKLRVLAHKMLKENKTQALLKKEAKNQAMSDMSESEGSYVDPNKSYFSEDDHDMIIAAYIGNRMSLS